MYDVKIHVNFNYGKSQIIIVRTFLAFQIGN